MHTFSNQFGKWKILLCIIKKLNYNYRRHFYTRNQSVIDLLYPCAWINYEYLICIGGEVNPPSRPLWPEANILRSLSSAGDRKTGEGTDPKCWHWSWFAVFHIVFVYFGLIFTQMAWRNHTERHSSTKYAKIMQIMKMSMSGVRVLPVSSQQDVELLPGLLSS